MGSWAYFRKHWIKPEVYPLIGSMAAALGVCGAAMINKIRDPTVTWNKAKRSGGTQEQLEGVDEIVPMWSQSKNSSIRIFGRENPVMSNKHAFTALPAPMTVTVAAESEEEEQDEEEAVEAPTETEPASAEEAPEPAAEAPAALAQPPVLDVVDEAAETINAAVDSAIQSAAAAVEAPGPAVSSVTETVAKSVEAVDAAVPNTPPVQKPAQD